ncbi:MAG: bifunctional 5,10-methylene-tetrahydrofolate dehydrogenase/5,10-methylene-tetrahydrofolate cyclohydrolase [Dehalococcoidia bacterium]|jgi:methylenetetrahydrofolate dehydrogenase (NADP+)/methenyltetrahydrofolate cyclohydrolase|nr:bifunctional 5,10-methylene-tetrahydrofolate dehydrogenase/5,10-methylene-tetrahydrofolate cyclohydrolase [Dehalococcoidia bacterium]
MSAQIIDGRAVAAAIRDELKERIARLGRTVPGLAAVVVGDDPAAASYLKGIARGCEAAGILHHEVRLPEDVTQQALESAIAVLNADDRFHGIILQLPLPRRLDTLRAESAISPDKDVDGTNPVSAGKLLLGEDTFFPSTAFGVKELLVRSGHSPEGLHVVICGRSNIVGKPLAGMLMQKQPGANATVTVCHTGTRNLAEITTTADILVAAIGRARAITADMVREGAVVIDVGVNQVEDPLTGKPRLVGDVDFDAVARKASAITPVPGGTGPVTAAMLLSNTVLAAERWNATRLRGRQGG